MCGCGRYIKTLEQFKVQAGNPQQEKIVVNVRNYLKVFLMLCAEDPKQPRRKPSLRALNGCEKTLNAVWKRAARRAPPPGSSPRDQSASRQLASPAGPPGNNPFNNPQLAPGGISGQTAGTVKQESNDVSV